MIETKIALKAAKFKRRKANERSEKRAQGIPVDPTTSETESGGEGSSSMQKSSASLTGA